MLSILIPAYCYGEGVFRILTQLKSLSYDNCELIIFDDSPDDQVEEIIANWSMAKDIQFIYKHNQPAYGAAANWNALLEAAKGEYCLLLHHDEFPLVDHFVKDIVIALRNDPKVDVLVLDCVLVDSRGGRNRRHLPTWLRAFVIRHFPEYLFRRNVIGPTSVIVIRRTLYPHFDARLKWLIDVDAYVRLFKTTRHFRFCPEIQIGSILDHANSVTATLGSSIPLIAREERAYLRDIHNNTSIWLGPASGESILYSVLYAFENLLWIIMRLFTRVSVLFHAPVSRKKIKKIMELSS